jgi:hypothetical protein
MKPIIDLSNAKSIVSGKRQVMKGNNTSEEVKINQLSKDKSG